MKTTRFTAAALALIVSLTFGAYAFDWKVQTNEELKGDMLVYAQGFADAAKGTKAAKIVNKLIKKQAKTTDQYSWIADTHEAVAELKKAYSPEIVIPGEKNDKADIRKWTLQLLDYPLHVDDRGKDTPQAMKEAYETAKQEYLSDARTSALAWVLGPTPKNDCLEVFKVYNMGYGFRTAKHTVLIDIRWDGTPEEADMLASKADIFLLTHPHGDHYSKTMLEALAKKGKTMILPSDVLPEYTGSNKHIIREAAEAVEIDGIKLNILPGNQGENIPNNVYIIEIDGWRIIHQGDNADYELQDRIADYPACDIVLGSTWNNAQRLMSAAMAADGGCMPVFIPGHENELSHHGVDHRESYHEMFDRKDRLGNPDFKYPPYMLMDIGECVVFSKQLYDPIAIENQYVDDGYTRTLKTQNTYAISKLVPKTSEIAIYNNIYDYLRGRVPGLTVKPDGSILIRGINTINGSTEPLIIVDGIPTSDIRSINPLDVKSIDVLKDASTSIYGARGGNGVIIIKLK